MCNDKQQNRLIGLYYSTIQKLSYVTFLLQQSLDFRKQLKCFSDQVENILLDFISKKL